MPEITNIAIHPIVEVIDVRVRGKSLKRVKGKPKKGQFSVRTGVVTLGGRFSKYPAVVTLEKKYRA